MSVASSLILRVTGAQSHETAEVPAIPGMRRTSASRLPALIIIFDGIQPQHGHSPPTRLSCTAATDTPALASFVAAYSPPGPMPITTTSNSRSLTRDVQWAIACCARR
jgi:hypothetical protein